MTNDKFSQPETAAAIIADVVSDEHILLDQIINTTMQTLHAEVCSIFLEDEKETGVLKCVAGSGFASKIVGIARYRVGEGFTGSIAQYGKEYNIKSRQELEHLEIDGKTVWKGNFDYQQWSSGSSEFRNLIALPLRIKGQILGVIKAENKIETYGDYFTDEDLLIFKTIANVISLALENARLHQKAEEQSKRVSTALAEIVSAVVGRYDMDTLLNQVINTMMKILRAEVCSIFLEDKEKEPGVLKCVAGSGFASQIVGVAIYKMGEGFTGSVAQYGGDEVYNIISRHELENLEIGQKKVWRGNFDKKQWPSGSNDFRNLLALPLKIKEQTFGVIKVENKIDEEFFSSEDETIFKIIANVIVLTIEKTRLQLRIEDQLKTISAKAAHRINNQITRYDGIIWRLNRMQRADQITRDDLRAIEKDLTNATNHIKRMVGEFRLYGKPIQLDKRSLNVNKIIKDEIWYAKPPDGIKIIDDLDPCIPEVEVDAARFPESIKEILGNAIRIIHKDIGEGRIVVTTRLIHNEMSHANEVLIRIEDNGPGFPSNFPVFAPFNSTDPQHTGLGLATVKENLEAHGGTVRLRENDGIPGACFELTLPVYGGKR